METKQNISIFWFRRDLRLQDNTALTQALKGPYPVWPVFIFDTTLPDESTNRQDTRLSFMYGEVESLYHRLRKEEGSLLVRHGKPLEVFKDLAASYAIKSVYTNRDYEPYAKARDREIQAFLQGRGVQFLHYKDQVIFDRKEILSEAGEPYRVFTPYSKKWLQKLHSGSLPAMPDPFSFGNFYRPENQPNFPAPESMGLSRTVLPLPARTVKNKLIRQYHQTRDFPGLEGTSRLGIHLRYGTRSIRQLAQQAMGLSETFLKQLIWRDFYMMILDHHPQLVNQALKPAYDRIPWRNNEEAFEKWRQGCTGIPLVDAGMRQLNQTGFMHNRLRMITASFLTKNLLIDWRWGEAYFAEKLLDYELASNNGGWQWAAGSGVDAQPYFRIFNPRTQAKTYDPDNAYIRQWVPEWNTPHYPQPMVDLKESRAAAIAVYKESLYA